MLVTLLLAASPAWAALRHGASSRHRGEIAASDRRGARANDAILITGMVVRGLDRRAIAGASISLSHGADPTPVDETLSLVNGSFILRAAPGIYRLRISGHDYSLYETVLRVGATGCPPIEARLSLRPAIHLRILDVNGRPLETGTIQAEARVSTRTGNIPTASQAKVQHGAVDIAFDRSVPVKRIESITVFVRDPVEGCAEITLDHWPASPVDVKLSPGYSISGTAVDAAGRPVNRAQVIGFRINGADPIAATPIEVATDPMGKFVIPSLLEGVYGVVINSGALQSRLFLIILTESKSDVRLVVDQKQKR